MSEITLYINYIISSKQILGPRTQGTESTQYGISDGEGLDKNLDLQQNNINEFLEPRKYQSQVIATFTETPDSKRSNSWPQLEQALLQCQESNATLVIGELGTLTSNESFTSILLASGVQFYCCDQPFVNQNILEALCKHAKVQRKLHGKLIREGLKMTSAKSGNPNAAEVISKVNKPKIDTAIVFAFLLQLIITDYRRKGYSQRQMVKTLNEEGFTAPEGGKWVLSQLQKVLDRVRLNELAIDNKSLIEELKQDDLSNEQIAEKLNTKGVTCFKRTAWDVNQVKKLISRIEQIKEIELINQFVLNLLPIIHEFRRRDLNPTQMIEQLDSAGLSVKQTKIAA